MTHRFDLNRDPASITIEVHGVLDPPATDELEALCHAQLQRGVAVQVRLATGTTAAHEQLERLVRLEGVQLEAASPFLALWLERCRTRA